MNSKWMRIFKSLMVTETALLPVEEALIPILIHSPQTQSIVGAVMVTESVFGQMYGIVPSAPIAPSPVAIIPAT